jgi:S1-C subfamily serine protease
VAALLGAGCSAVFAQATTPAAPQAPQRAGVQVESSGRQSSQVVTVVHRLNGIKALALLQRNGEAVSMADDQIVTAANAVTSIIAGFVLGDGQSVVARLPQAEAEVEASSFFSPVRRPQAPNQLGAPSQMAPLASTSPMALAPLGSGFVVVHSSGKQSTAKYVGLDSESGLSLLKIAGLDVPVLNDADESQLAVGQSIRLFAPVRVAKEPSSTQSVVSMRVGEIEGKIAEITRTSTGRIIRLTIKAPNLSSAIVGGVALNEAGQAVGIVEASNDGAARLIPAAVVRRAAARVLTRQASVPRPWLGVRGEPVATTSLETFYVSGWTPPEAAALKGSPGGILLTSVAPGTPAAHADLRAGDVIVRVNDFDIKNAEDFSFVLNEVGSGATAKFTLFRGQTPSAPMMPSSPPATYTPQPTPPSTAAPNVFRFKSMVVPVKLSEALSPARAMRMAETYAFAFPGRVSVPTLARGLETVLLSSKAATHLGARGGLLVVFVDPDSSAARSGLQVFDVIETIDGKLLGRSSWTAAVKTAGAQKLLLGVVREKKQVEITVHPEK